LTVDDTATRIAAQTRAQDIRRFDRAVGKLTKRWTTDIKQRIPGSGRKLATVTHDPLIVALTGAVVIGLAGRKSGGSGTGSILNEIAFQKVRDITRDVNTAWRRLIPSSAVFLRTWDVPLEQLLGIWHGTFHHHEQAGTVTPTHLRTEADRWEGWVKLIELMFDPPALSSFTGECPTCHTGWVTISAEEEIDAVVINFGTAIATCRACGEVWTGRAGLQRLADTHTPRTRTPKETGDTPQPPPV